MSKFKDGRVHFRISGVKGLTLKNDFELGPGKSHDSHIK